MSNRSIPIMPADCHPLSRQPVRSELKASDTPLGRARIHRGWSQEKTVRALSLQAEHWGWEVATQRSLKVLISRWENGINKPSQTYQVLFCAIFHAAPEELGFNVPTACEAVVLDTPMACPGHAELLARIDVLEEQLRRITDLLLSWDQEGVQLVRG